MTDWYSYPTNYSNGTEVSGVADLFFNFPMHIVGSLYSTGILIMIWLMSFVLSMSGGVGRAITIASFIGTIFSVWIVAITGGGLNISLMFLMIGLMIIGAILSKNEGGGL